MLHLTTHNWLYVSPTHLIFWYMIVMHMSNNYTRFHYAHGVILPFLQQVLCYTGQPINHYIYQIHFSSFIFLCLEGTSKSSAVIVKCFEWLPWLSFPLIHASLRKECDSDGFSCEHPLMVILSRFVSVAMHIGIYSAAVQCVCM